MKYKKKNKERKPTLKICIVFQWLLCNFFFNKFLQHTFQADCMQYAIYTTTTTTIEATATTCYITKKIKKKKNKMLYKNKTGFYLDTASFASSFCCCCCCCCCCFKLVYSRRYSFAPNQQATKQRKLSARKLQFFYPNSSCISCFIFQRLTAFADDDESYSLLH